MNLIIQFLFIKVGTFFEHLNLTIKEVFALSYFWAQKYSAEHAARESGISKRNVVRLFRKFRRICRRYFRQNPILLGGQNVTIEADETYMTRRHANRGRRVRRRSRWIFTMVERGTGRSYLKIVRRRDAATLLAIILRHVRPFTDINTDSWRSYRVLARFPMFRHRFVNHNQNFVDPADRNLHTQTIENKNGQWKEHVRIKHGISDYSIHDHLNEFMWRDRFGTRDNVFFNFWSQVVGFYPCNP